MCSSCRASSWRQSIPFAPRLASCSTSLRITWTGTERWKATSVDATLKAVDAFPGRLWIILGGKDKGSDYGPLREPLREKAHSALVIGAAAQKIGSQLDGAVEVVQCETLANAVHMAARRA